ncbi:MAG TPA: outer membrane beta-barrel protein [Candidatus Binataceae bacterium]|nr:outer membrane beta-barrel protein [Candidatus Binataceae bacterium]
MFRRYAHFVSTAMLAGLLAYGTIAKAQEVATPIAELGANYSWLHVNSANDIYHRTGNGGSGYLEYNINKSLGLVADFGGYANTRTGLDDKAMTYMFGPRFNWRHARLTPYVQLLFGGIYAWVSPTGLGSITQNAFAMSAGGGLDIQVSHHISFKPVQVEYLMSQLNDSLGFGGHQNDIRYSAGIVFRVGDTGK